MTQETFVLYFTHHSNVWIVMDSESDELLHLWLCYIIVIIINIIIGLNLF